MLAHSALIALLLILPIKNHKPNPSNSIVRTATFYENIITIISGWKILCNMRDKSVFQVLILKNSPHHKRRDL